jgi:hypothetical protein
MLTEFVEAVLGDDEGRLDRSRRAIYETLGAAAMVDTAGAVASFNAVVKVADGAGIEIDEFKLQATDEVSKELGFRHWSDDGAP